MTLNMLAAKLDRLLARQETPQRFLGIEQAAQYTGLSRETIKNLMKAKKLRAYRPSARRVVLDREELDRYVLATAKAQ